MLSNDLFYIFNWWVWILLFGVVSLPITNKLFGKFFGAGYGLSKTIGIIIFGYSVFFLSIIQILPLSRNVLLIFFMLYAAFNYWVFKKDTSLAKNIKKNVKVIAFIEILFTFGLFSWSIIRGYQPDINGLEKFMDFGFINSILKSEYLPPADMWFAGGNINYYWFGHFVTALFTKLSNIPSSVTYNLMIATILGLSLTSAFTISASLLKFLNNKFNLRILFAAGFISAILLNFAGNFHTVFFFGRQKVCNDSLLGTLTITSNLCSSEKANNQYWYPDATRFIGYDPDREDKTIHEFPLYSYVVSDLHAHLLNLPFVLIYLALLINYVNKKTNIILSKELIPLGFTAGIMFITSTWDFGNYLLTTGITLFAFEFRKSGVKIRTILHPVIKFLSIAVMGILFALPFILNFNSITEGFDFVNSHSYLWQLAVLWGLPLILSAIFLAFLAKRYKSLRKMGNSDLFILSIHLASWLLIIIPEIFYVKDIYIASHHRANTMFKLTYQSFVMFYLSGGYIAVRMLTYAKNKTPKVALTVFFAIIFSAVLSYPSFAIKSYYNGLNTYKGLNGTTWLETYHPDLYKVVNWLNKNTDGQVVILEAPGDSYTEYNVVSSYTGLPTVSGWFVHEWLWRGSSEIPQSRVSDITQIYNTSDFDIARSLLQKYDVEYVIVGEFEREKFPELNEEKFNKLGGEIFTSGNTSVYKIK